MNLRNPGNSSARLRPPSPRGYDVAGDRHNEWNIPSLVVCAPTDIQLVVTDMIMPIMDEITLVRPLLSVNSLVKVICVSGHVSEAQRMEVTTLGIQAFLAKPNPIDALIKSVHRSLNPEPSLVR